MLLFLLFSNCVHILRLHLLLSAGFLFIWSTTKPLGQLVINLCNLMVLFLYLPFIFPRYTLHSI
nr:MAG TPA: hypothetical protein [Caudoviricetes sp.]